MKYAEVAKLKHEEGCAFLKGDDYCDCGAIEKAITEKNDALRSALEHTLSNFKLILEQKPVRDADETIAEAEAALRM